MKVQIVGKEQKEREESYYDDQDHVLYRKNVEYYLTMKMEGYQFKKLVSGATYHKLKKGENTTFVLQRLDYDGKFCIIYFIVFIFFLIEVAIIGTLVFANLLNDAPEIRDHDIHNSIFYNFS